MKTSFWKSLTVLALVLALAGFSGIGGKPSAPQKQETALDRVIRTGTIRCGYIPWAPYFMMDPQTGAKSGIAYEYMTAIGKELGVRVEWVEEVSWGTFFEGLNTNRYDVLCAGLWESGNRARAALLTRPLYADKLFAYARADDHRFDGGLSTVNQAGVRVADYDGDITQQVRAMDFPLTQDLAVPSITSEGEYLLNVTTRKADVVLVGLDPAARYNKAAPEKLKMVGDKPVRLFSSVMAVRHGENDLKAALDSTIHALIKSGTATALIKNYPGQTEETGGPF